MAVRTIVVSDARRGRAWRRGEGLGKALLVELALVCVERGYGHRLPA